LIYKIITIKNDEYKITEQNNVQIKHKFLYESVLNEIKCFKNEEEGITYYKFFNNITFIILSAEDKISVDSIKVFGSDNIGDVYYSHFFDKDQLDDEISISLRNSSTLKIDNENSYNSKNMRVVFAEKGFVLCNKTQTYDLSDNFDRLLLLFLLSLAYNSYTEVLINDVTKAYNSSDYKKMIELRNEIYSFGLKCFFHNPVKQNRHETFNLWNLISENYYVNIKHHEMKSQVADLTGVIESKYKDIEHKKSKRLEKTLSIFGFIIAITSLIGVYKDLKEFGLF